MINWYEKVKMKLRKFGRKNFLFKILSYVALFFVKPVFLLTRAVSMNYVRILIAGIGMLFFVISASFTKVQAEIPQEEAVVEAETQEVIESDTPVVVYIEEEKEDEFNLEEILSDSENIIDDTEVYDGEEIEFDEYEEALIATPDESYNAEDILGENDNVDIDASEETELDPDAWYLVLINKQHPVPDDYEFTLDTLYGSLRCDERVKDNVLAMIKAAKEDGINLVINSPYRDYNLQVILFQRKIEKYMAMGYSYMEAYEIGSMTVTVPGASEHQIGLAFDITCDYYQKLNKGFGDTEAGLWLREHCKEFGFIIRYPEGKEYITGINYEPWHFRYVGVEAATKIMDEGITLEELIDELETNE